MNAELRAMHCGNGFFFEIVGATLDDIGKLFSAKDQTLSVFGYDRDEIASLLDHVPTRAIDRVVRIGQALSFGPVWDGYDLFTHLTREIDVDI